jgi:hypothetical protein
MTSWSWRFKKWSLGSTSPRAIYTSSQRVWKVPQASGRQELDMVSLFWAPQNYPAPLSNACSCLRQPVPAPRWELPEEPDASSHGQGVPGRSLPAPRGPAGQRTHDSSCCAGRRHQPATPLRSVKQPTGFRNPKNTFTLDQAGARGCCTVAEEGCPAVHLFRTRGTILNNSRHR